MSEWQSALPFAAGSLLLVLGCFDAELCREYPPSSAEPLSSETLEQSVRLSDAGEFTTAAFLATLSGLPELWPSQSPVRGSGGNVKLTLSYESEPRGSDGLTEMPRVEVSVAFGSDAPRAILQTAAYPNTEAGGGFSLFTPCSSTVDSAGLDQRATNSSGACCPYGARECEAPFTISLRRLDGAPFPPLVVEWGLSVSAQVDSCPGAGDPELSFERASP
jgi:hypothetical protein